MGHQLGDGIARQWWAYCLLFSWITGVLSASGLEFRPTPRNSGSTLIWYKPSDKNGTKYWQNDLDNFLEPYTSKKNFENLQECRQGEKPYEGKACDVNLDGRWAPCLKEYGYGYGSDYGGPCVFLKLNKGKNWKPEFYNSTTALPESMPYDLKNVVTLSIRRGLHEVVWVACQGEDPSDIENIGPIVYIPRRGFPNHYFSGTNVKGYLTPLVAVHFEKPQRGIVISIECKIWTRNDHDRVNFQLLID